MTKLARLRGLSSRDLVILAQLAAFSCVVAMSLRMTGWRRVSQRITTASRSRWLRRFPLLHSGYSIERLSPLVDMASSAFPRTRCLVRSMVLLWLLGARGEAGQVVLGVRKRAGVFEAHAWTVSDRGLVGERPETVAEFEQLMTSGRQDQA